MQALKLVGSLRGAGALLSGSLKINVSYAIDLFRRGQMRVAGGEVDGRMAVKLRTSKACTLRLEGGELIVVALREVAADFASFDADEAGSAICHDVFENKTTPAAAA
jgi:hypothetical protein